MQCWRCHNPETEELSSFGVTESAKLPRYICRSCRRELYQLRKAREAKKAGEDPMGISEAARRWADAAKASRLKILERGAIRK